VLPGRAKDPGGFIATEATHPFSNRRVYVSAEAVRIMANEYGFVSREDVAGLREDLADANTRIAQLEQELEEADRFQSHIDGITKHGFQVKRAPGRPSLKKA
jgi:hypothetical protein